MPLINSPLLPIRRVALILTALVGWTLIARAQVTPGTENFVAYDSHEVDSVNLSNNNVILNAQIMGKNGAMGFNFGVNGSFYMLGNSGTWLASLLNAPVLRSHGHLGEAANGFLATTTSSLASNTTSTANCPGSGTTTKYSKWSVVGSDGTTHALPSNAYSDKTSGGTSCLTGSGFTATTTDNSGITAVVAANGTSPSSVYLKNGTALTTSAIIDSNGNSISLTSGAYKDSMGLTALTVTGTYPTNTFTWSDVNGGSPYASIGSISKIFGTSFNCSSVQDGFNNVSASWPSSLSYYDGTTLSWTYEPLPSQPTTTVTGRMGTITLREGGTIAYNYSGGTNGIDCTYWNSPVITRTLGNGDVTTYTLTHPQIGTSANYQAVNTVLDPGGNKTIYTFTGYTSSGNSTTYAQVLTMVQRYQGASTLLTTDKYCYNTNAMSCETAAVTLPISEVDVYHTISGMGNSSRQQTTYDGYGNVTYSAAYGFGGTSPVRATTTTYYQTGTSCGPLSSGSYVNDKPCEVQASQDGSVVADAKYTYDLHGNLLTSLFWTGSSWIGQSTANSYNANGTPSNTYDLANNHTVYTYDSSKYSDACTGATQYPFATKIAKGGLSTSATYDCTGAVKLTDVDASGNTTTYGYRTSGGTADPYWRVSSVTDPYGTAAYKTYATGAPFVSNGSLTFNSGNSINSTTKTTDTFGRVVSAQTAQSPGGTNFDTSTSTFGWNGNYLETKTSLPCSTANNGTCTVVHTNDTDPLGRLYTSATVGNETLTHTYAQNDDLAVLTPAPSGENSKQVQTEFDGLGRVTKVCRIGNGSTTACGQSTGSANGVTTSITYTSVTGSQTVSSTRGSQTRSQTIDGLGRVTSSTTPEGGTVTYSYDSYSGAICGSTSGQSYPGKLQLKSFANGNNECYLYDGLGRLTDIGGAYSVNHGTTVCRRYRFDNSQGVTGTLPTGISPQNSSGRLVEAETDNCTLPIIPITDEWLSYDKDGNVTDMWEKTPHSGIYYHSVATFAANGVALTVQLANPKLYTMTYGLDGEGRPSTLKGNSTIVVSGTTFNAAGQPTYIDLGTGTDQSDYVYDPNTARMTNWTFQVGSTSSETGALTWNPNGTLKKLAITDGFNAAGTQTCHFNPTDAASTGYDDTGRLVGIDCGAGGWGQTFSYDQYDNVTKSVISGRTGVTWNPGYNSANNHYSTGANYDNSGNVTYDTIHLYTWDPYGKLSTIDSSTCGKNGECVTYDALGRIVETSYNTAYTEIWYTQLGKVYMTGGTTPYFAYWPTPGNGTVEVNGNAVTFFYMHKDWLGNARISSAIVNPTVVSDQAYAPYGEVYNKLATGAGVPAQMFTGDTQDIIGGIFDTPARELNASQGRWLSPDPAGAGWNQYAYATNPNSGIDPSGLYVWYDGPGNGGGSMPGVVTGSAGGCSSSCGLALGQVSFGNSSAGADLSELFADYNPDIWVDSGPNTPSPDWQSITMLPFDAFNAGLEAIWQTVFAAPTQMLGNAMDSISQTLCGDSSGACIAMAAPELSLAAGTSDAVAFFQAASQPAGSSVPVFVFWSGPGMQEAANAWAVQNGGVTIEMTSWGQEAQLTEQIFGKGSPEATQAWQSASVSFADSATGQVHVFSSQPFTNFRNDWYNFELPAVGNNPNVTGATFHVTTTP